MRKIIRRLSSLYLSFFSQIQVLNATGLFIFKKILQKPLRTEVETELLEHAKEELMHADRIVKLNMKKIWRILL